MTPDDATLIGKAALVAEVGDRKFRATWTSDSHRARRLLAPFIWTFGLMFVLSAGAAILAKYGGGTASFCGGPYAVVALLPGAALGHHVPRRHVVALESRDDVAFALRGDMGWAIAGVY